MFGCVPLAMQNPSWGAAQYVDDARSVRLVDLASEIIDWSAHVLSALKGGQKGAEPAGQALSAIPFESPNNHKESGGTGSVNAPRSGDHDLHLLAFHPSDAVRNELVGLDSISGEALLVLAKDSNRFIASQARARLEMMTAA